MVALVRRSAAGKRARGLPDRLRPLRARERFAGWTHSTSVASAAASRSLGRCSAVPIRIRAGALLRRRLLQRRLVQCRRGDLTDRLPTRSASTEAIASWNASTPAGTWIETWIRATDRRSLDEVVQPRRLGVGDSSTIERHSVNCKATPTASSIVDTLVLDGKKARPGNAYQLKVRLFSENAAAPTVRNVVLRVLDGAGQVRRRPRRAPAWRTPDCSTVPSARRWSIPTAARSGAARPRRRWCSATGTRSRRRCESRVRSTVVDGVFDWIYDGHGNWPFNTACAATRDGARHGGRTSPGSRA